MRLSPTAEGQDGAPVVTRCDKACAIEQRCQRIKDIGWPADSRRGRITPSMLDHETGAAECKAPERYAEHAWRRIRHDVQQRNESEAGFAHARCSTTWAAFQRVPNTFD